MEPVLAVEPVIISPWLTPSKSPCQVLSDVSRVISFAFSKSVGSGGSHLDVEGTLGMDHVRLLLGCDGHR
jgi:hypothetical protein